MQQPATPKTSEFEAFKRLAKGLVAVPKKEVAQKAQARKPRHKKK